MQRFDGKFDGSFLSTLAIWFAAGKTTRTCLGRLHVRVFLLLGNDLGRYMGLQLINALIFLLLTQVGINSVGGADVSVSDQLLGGVFIHIRLKKHRGISVPEYVGCQRRLPVVFEILPTVFPCGDGWLVNSKAVSSTI